MSNAHTYFDLQVVHRHSVQSLHAMETQQTRRELFFILSEEKNQSQQCEFLQEHVRVIKDMGLQERSQEGLKEVRKTISRFCSTVFQKWISSHRMLDRFLLHNSEWLDKKLFVPVSPVPHTAKGQQEETFSESSERSKRRKTEGLCKTTSTEELSFATR